MCHMDTEHLPQPSKPDRPELLHQFHVMKPRLIEKLQNSIKKFDECYDKIDETYCDGAVEGYTPAMLLGKDFIITRFMLNYFAARSHELLELSQI